MRTWHGFLDCLQDSLLSGKGPSICPRCWAFGQALIDETVSDGQTPTEAA